MSCHETILVMLQKRYIIQTVESSLINTSHSTCTLLISLGAKIPG